MDRQLQTHPPEGGGLAGDFRSLRGYSPIRVALLMYGLKPVPFKVTRQNNYEHLLCDAKIVVNSFFPLGEDSVRCLFFLACPVVFASIAVPAQTPTTAAPGQAGAEATAATVFYNDAEGTPPELLPAQHSFPVRHCKKVDGVAVLGEVVDASGVPSQFTVLHTAGADVEHLALDYAAGERFKPGVHDGEPVAVAIEQELALAACKQKALDASGNKEQELVLAAVPVSTLEVAPPPRANSHAPAQPSDTQGTYPGLEKIRPGVVNPPRPVNVVEAKFSDDARRFRMQGVCLISMVVDTNGEPKNIRIIRSLEPSLDLRALEAVAQYRFKPATKDGQPVPVAITVEVNFHLY
jgi:TonB family protein